jgi:hypothetical protein
MKIGDTLIYHSLDGDVPMIVVRVNDDGTVNGRVFTDSLEGLAWMTNVSEGDTYRTWSPA